MDKKIYGLVGKVFPAVVDPTGEDIKPIPPQEYDHDPSFDEKQFEKQFRKDLKESIKHEKEIQGVK